MELLPMGNTPPLADHMLGILEMKDPIAALQKELKRYVHWVILHEADMTSRAASDPRDLPPATWNDKELQYVTFSRRERVLMCMLEAMENEEKLMRECTQTELPTHKLLMSILEHSDELPCPSNHPTPSGTAHIRIIPPMQKLWIEMKKLEEHVQSTAEYDEIRTVQYELLRLVITHWVLELAPLEYTHGKVKLTPSANWVITLYAK